MLNHNIYLFVYTVKEYKRLFKKIQTHRLIDTYDEEQYKEINMRLLLLRKYGNYKDPVCIEKVITSLINKYPDEKNKFEFLLNDYKNIEKQNLEFILSNGKKLNLYETIENTMYGLYLHADYDKVCNLLNSKENLRFPCIRKYVEEIEKVIFTLYDEINNLEKDSLKLETREKATIIYIGDALNNKQQIKKSPYWSNLYGKDGSIEDEIEILENMNNEDACVLDVAISFLNELESNNNVKKLSALIYPTTEKDWDNFDEAKKFFKSIKKPGIRYNDNHTMAYVRLFPSVEELFIIDTPHIISDMYEICLVKDKLVSNWKVFSIGSHIDNYIIND